MASRLALGLAEGVGSGNLDGVSVDLHVGRVLGLGSWLVGVDGHAEAIAVSDVVDGAVDAIGGLVAVAAGLAVPLVTGLLLADAAAILTGGVVAEGVWVGGLRRRWHSDMRSLLKKAKATNKIFNAARCYRHIRDVQ